MSQPDVQNNERNRDTTDGEILPEDEVSDDAVVVDLTDLDNQSWLDSPERTRPPVTEWSDDRLQEFGEEVRSKLDDIDE